MHTNVKLNMLIRACKIYCSPLIQKYDPKCYPQITKTVMSFTHKLFGTKKQEDKMKVQVRAEFMDYSHCSDYIPRKYQGVVILISFADGNEIEFSMPTKAYKDYIYHQIC